MERISIHVKRSENRKTIAYTSFEPQFQLPRTFFALRIVFFPFGLQNPIPESQPEIPTRNFIAESQPETSPLESQPGISFLKLILRFHLWIPTRNFIPETHSEIPPPESQPGISSRNLSLRSRSENSDVEFKWTKIFLINQLRWPVPWIILPILQLPLKTEFCPTFKTLGCQKVRP